MTLRGCKIVAVAVMLRRHYTASKLNVDIGPQLGGTLNGHERGKLTMHSILME